MIVQPYPRPATIKAYLQIRDQLIDTHGNPLVREPCARCAHTHYTVEPCAHEVPCPVCGSTRARCLRPSEHEAATWHRERQDALEALCAEREAQGLPQVARWPQPATTTPAADHGQETLF